jgi:hypothetical protein
MTMYSPEAQWREAIAIGLSYTSFLVTTQYFLDFLQGELRQFPL